MAHRHADHVDPPRGVEFSDLVEERVKHFVGECIGDAQLAPRVLQSKEGDSIQSIAKPCVYVVEPFGILPELTKVLPRPGDPEPVLLRAANANLRSIHRRALPVCSREAPNLV